MSTVFISYRREITAGEARALFNELLGKLGENSVFMDVDSIALGRDFRGALQKTLESCDLMLVLIGRDWADVKDEEGRPRLHNPGDFVRLEIEAALKRDIVVTPILVQGAHMPAPEQLPAEIRDLVYRNGFELSHNRWESDFAEMTRRLNLDIAKEGRRVEQYASTVPAHDASIAPAARPATPGRQFFNRPLRVTRRQALGVAALTAAGAGAIIAATSIRTRRSSRASIFLSRASLGTRRKNFACASPRSPGVPIGCRVKPSGNMPAARARWDRSISGRPSPPSWRIIVEPAVRYVAKVMARASPPTSIAAAGVNRVPMVWGPPGGSHGLLL